MKESGLKRYISKPWLLVVVSWLSFVLLRFACWISKLQRPLIALTTKAMVYASEQTDKKYNNLARLISRYMVAEDLNARLSIFLNRHSCAIPSSCKAALTLRNYYYDNAILPEWKLHNKIAGARFAQMLQVRTPRLYSERVPFKDIVPQDNVVIKPLNMYYGHGVFFVRSIHNIQELNTKRMFDSWEVFSEYIGVLLRSGTVTSDVWLVEELITDEKGEIPTDLKFNMFYGHIGWIAAIDRLAGPKYHIMDSTGLTIKSGLYRKDELYIGEKVTQEQMELVKKISLEIPVPCIRIDFLRRGEELIFGEFTPIAGATGLFKKERDSKYGGFYHEAEARLFNDLLAGKKFETYHALLSDSY